MDLRLTPVQPSGNLGDSATAKAQKQHPARLVGQLAERHRHVEDRVCRKEPGRRGQDRGLLEARTALGAAHAPRRLLAMARNNLSEPGGEVFLCRRAVHVQIGRVAQIAREQQHRFLCDIVDPLEMQTRGPQRSECCPVQLILIPGMAREQPPYFVPLSFALGYSLVKHAEKLIAQILQAAVHKRLRTATLVAKLTRLWRERATEEKVREGKAKRIPTMLLNIG